MLYALIVIYNKECGNCKTLNKLLEYKSKIDLIIFDNSTKPNNNESFCKQNNLTYFTKHENLGLSKAYNYSIENTEKKTGNYIIILDDDTELSDEYINEALDTTNKNEFDLILPVVKSDKIIMSPAKLQFGCRGKAVKNLNKLNLNKCTAINSGMIIKLDVFNNLKYNENLFLDSVDHDFMCQIHAQNIKIHIMDSIIYQNFSREEKSSIESALIRFNIYKKDFKTFCKTYKKMWFYKLSILKFGIKECIKYKTTKFLPYIFS